MSRHFSFQLIRYIFVRMKTLERLRIAEVGNGMKIVADIPDELIDKAETLKEGIVEAQVENNQIIVELANPKAGQEQQRAIRYALAGFILTFIIAAAFFSTAQIKLVGMTGAHSITQLTIYLGVVFGSLGFSYVVIRAQIKRYTHMNPFNLLTVILAYTMLGFVGIATLTKAVSSAFAGAQLDPYTASVVIAALVSVMNYVMIIAGHNINFKVIIRVLSATLLGGVLFTMITNGSAGWWQHNFSYLGTNRVGNGWIFNFTLIFSGFIMITLLDYLFSLLGASWSSNRGLFITRILFSLTATSLALVGVIPNNRGWQHEVHDFFAQSLVVLIIMMIIFIRWLVPKLNQEFLLVSYLMGISLVVAEVLFQGIHYLTLMSFELLSSGIAFAWLILLLQNMETMATRIKRSVTVKIEV